MIIALAGMLALIVGSTQDTSIGGYLVLFCAFVGVAIWLRGKLIGSAVTGNKVTVHGHGATDELTARHEAGHIVAPLAKLGGKVRRVEVGEDWGLVSATMPGDIERTVAFLYAGQYAAGSSAGSGADDANVRRLLREVPSGERSAVHSEGKRLALARSSDVDYYAARLAAGKHWR